VAPAATGGDDRGDEAHPVELGAGFRAAREALGSDVRRVECNVYDLTPEALGGPVDLAFAGAILLHLRDPVRALERILSTLRPGGELRVLEPVSLWGTLTSPRRPMADFHAAGTRFNWWYPNVAGLRAWMLAAGFIDPRRLSVRRVRMPNRRLTQPLCAMTARRPG
jgi:hypothetical protein